MFEVFTRNSNNNIVILKGERESFRLRQRSKGPGGVKVRSLRFVSFKEAKKMSKKKNVSGPFRLYTVSKL
jgi:hypothetical protein